MPGLPDHLTSAQVASEKLGGEILKRHQRDRVIQASIEVFATRGYSETTVDDLVSAAHVGVGNFYELLGGKEGCFEAALDSILADLGGHLEGVPQQKKWADQLLAFLDALVVYAEAEPPAARLLLIESKSAGKRTQQKVEKALTRCSDFLSVGRAQSRKSSASATESLEFGLIAGTAGAVRDLLESNEPIGPARDSLAEFLLHPYLGAAEIRKAVKR